jgi:hypothetical protein
MLKMNERVYFFGRPRYVVTAWPGTTWMFADDATYFARSVEICGDFLTFLPAILLILFVDVAIRHPGNVVADNSWQWLG